MEKPDLDGYPILRIDQLSLIDVTTLENSVPDAKALMESLRQESNKGGGRSQKSMVKYLQKQVDQTMKEIATRAAEDRVNALLNGSKKLLVRAISPNLDREKNRDNISPVASADVVSSASVPKPTTTLSTPQTTHSESGTSTHNVTHSHPPEAPKPKQNDPPPVAFYEPIPLPSQLAAAKPMPSRAQTKEHEEEKHMQDYDKERGLHQQQQQQDNLHMSRSAGSSRRNASDNELLTSRSSGTVRSPLAPTINPDSESAYIPTVPGSNPKPKRRPRSGNAASDNKPKSIYSQSNMTGTTKQQSQMQIQQNFGNAFMVGATEKKKRFYPKKVIQETDAERREKLREKGRNQAMMRLLDRKNKQIERNEEMKLRRMEEKSAAAKKKKRRD